MWKNDLGWFEGQIAELSQESSVVHRATTLSNQAPDDAPSSAPTIKYAQSGVLWAAGVCGRSARDPIAEDASTAAMCQELPSLRCVTGSGGARGGGCGCSHARSRHSVQIQPIKVATKSGYA